VIDNIIILILAAGGTIPLLSVTIVHVRGSRDRGEQNGDANGFSEATLL
jgi:hypothetical protein